MDAGKREGILEAAAKAFSKLGFRKASIADIAAAAGVAKGTVYLCADSKKDLFYQALLRDVRRFIGDLGSLIDPSVPADELLRQQQKLGVQFLDKRPLARALIMGSIYLELAGWEARLEEVRAMVRASIAEVLRLGVRQGRFRSDLDVDRTAEVLQDIQLAGELFLHRLGRRDPELLAQRMEAGMDIILRGLMAPGESPAAPAA